MLYRIFSVTLLCFLLSQSVSGQDTTTIVRPDTSTDSLLVEADKAIEKNSNWPVPKKALLWSIIPSGGQVYNRDWWKVPLVAGGFYALYRTIDYNTDLYRRLQDAYLLKLDNKEHEFTGTSIDNVRTLRNLRDRYDKNTQMSYVFLLLGYALQGIEAYVDAHLRQFDIDDDLSFRLKPTLEMLPVSGQAVMGVGVVIPIK
ncbi:DUF5683 domain-containing protein [Flavilitoribacter nigricans]|uniref:DUF5683 domain-containing protein n=1 Tax=Flavilitoribacter nigricans TaxID=70997 RepID=UPI00147656AC|nr:DUF5683 domain-containing protein [Flavilitoribacter nigricans]